VEKTAFVACMMRAMEGHVWKPLFVGPLAERFLTGLPAVVLSTKALRWLFMRLIDRAGPGFYGSVVCRTLVIDDACRQALAGGVAQVVILDAGMDTRPYRLLRPLGRAPDVYLGERVAVAERARRRGGQATAVQTRAARPATTQ
jgi:methyltransferase (TIGR00027 family)